MTEHDDSPRDARPSGRRPTELGDGESCCAEWEPRLLQRLLGELDDEHRRDLELHLETCTRCAHALASARVGLGALGALEQPPLPFGDPLSPPGTEAAESQSGHDSEPGGRARWHDFVRQQRLERSPPRVVASSGWRLLAAAALLLIGFGLGRLQSAGAPAPAGSLPSNASVTAETYGGQTSFSGDSIAALARAELLADQGIGYVSGLQHAVAEVLELEVERLDSIALADTRERARELIRDGRFLRRTLDTRLDGQLLHAIDRAELLLEEVAALAAGSEGLQVTLVQEELRSSDLQDLLAELDVERQVDLAIAASGDLATETS